MNKLLAKYADTLYKHFQWVGIPNKGLQRILLIIYTPFIISICLSFFGFWFRFIFDGWYESEWMLQAFIIIFFIFIFIALLLTIILKILTWILKGFKEPNNE